MIRAAEDDSIESLQAAVQMVDGFLYEHFANLVGITSAPVLQFCALHLLVECTQGWGSSA
jgi:hypothetical protein